MSYDEKNKQDINQLDINQLEKKKKEKEWYGKKHIKKAWKRMKEDFELPVFSILLVLLISFYIWADRFQPNMKLRRAAQSGMLAFLIGYLARLDLVFISAMMVFIVVMVGHRRPGE